MTKNEKPGDRARAEHRRHLLHMFQQKQRIFEQDIEKYHEELAEIEQMKKDVIFGKYDKK